MGKLHCSSISETVLLGRELNNKNKYENTKTICSLWGDRTLTLVP